MSNAMTVTYTAQLQAHPWDLWGLAKLFRAMPALGARVLYDEPMGAPARDYSKEGLAWYQARGFDQFAQMELDAIPGTPAGETDHAILWPALQEFMLTVRGLARLLDPEFWGVTVLSLDHKTPHGGGAMVGGRPPPNKAYSNLARTPQHGAFGQDVIALALADGKVRFVLATYTMPISWVSLYLVYEAIASEYGGPKSFADLAWVSKTQLGRFTEAANNTRVLAQGIRHAHDKIDPTRALMPLVEGQTLIVALMHRWLEERLAAVRAANTSSP